MKKATPLSLDPTSAAAISRRSRLRFLVDTVRNPLEALPPEIYRERLVYSRFAGSVRIHLADPILIHEALVRNAEFLVKGEDLRRALGPVLGQGLLTTDGANWRWQRHAVSPAFRHETLQSMLPLMIGAAERP